MDENLLSLLEELSLRASYSEDELTQSMNNETQAHRRSINSGSYCSNSNVSSPNYDQLVNNIADEDHELKNAVNSLFQELSPSRTSSCPQQSALDKQNVGYDKSKLLVALLGNIDLVTCAVKKINQLVSMGKRMEQIYRCFYIDPNVQLDLEEISQLVVNFTNIYNSESYVREVNVSRVYDAYCKKLIQVLNSRTNQEYSGHQIHLSESK